MMTHAGMKTMGLGAAVALAAALPASALTFRQIATLDTAALNAGVPGSVAAYGDDVFVGTLFPGATLTRITDPLGTPTNAGTLGPGGPVTATTNGFVSLNTDGTTLVAATNNGGADPDVAQVFDVATGNLNWTGDSSPASLNIGGDRIDGAGVDPVTGNVLLTAFGSGTQHLFQASAAIPPVPAPTPTGLFDPPVGTGWRDVDFDNATGDLYLRAVNGVARGIRNGDDDYVRLDGTTAGIQTIVNMPDGFNSAINVEFIPASAAGQDLVIFNHRNSDNTFADQVLVYDANAVDVAVAVDFLATDGTPFVPADAASGIYDFSFDPVNDLLYVSDFSSSAVYVFQVPEPASMSLLGLGGLALLRRRTR